jgi:activating signal cointegrator 1
MTSRRYDLPHDSIPAISLWQPYASLIAAGVKPYETRGFAPPARLLGHRIAIHAAKRVPVRGELGTDVEAAISAALGRDDWFGRDGLPLGAVVCTAVIFCAIQIYEPLYERGIARTDRTITQFWDAVHQPPSQIPIDLFGDYSAGRWCWELKDIEVLPDPIPARGRQMIGWSWSGTRGIAA